MTEDKKIILNDDQYNLNVLTGDISIPIDKVNAKGYYKQDNKHSVVHKVWLDRKSAAWFKEAQYLPFYYYYAERDEFFLNALFNYIDSEFDNEEDKEEHFVGLIQAYFCGYYTKERKYNIIFNLGNDLTEDCLAVTEDDEWVFATLGFTNDKVQFTQLEIDKMQKDPRSKGFDLNKLKREIPEDLVRDDD